MTIYVATLPKVREMSRINPNYVVPRWWTGPCGAREVMKIAMPLVLSSLSWTILTFVDRMFLLWWSEESLAASFPSSLLWWMLLCCPLGICMYASTFVSQYYGAGQLKRIGPVVWQAVWIGLALSPLAMLPVFVAEPIFRWAGHTPVVRAQEVIYFRILTISTPGMLVAHAFSAFYSGQGRTWTVMVVDSSAVLLNVLLDYLWIFGHAGFPAGGIAGGAWATAVSVTLRVVVYFVLLARPANRVKFASLAWRPDGKLLRRLLSFGGPAGMQMLLEVAGFTLFVLLVGSLGVEQLAATNLAFNVSSVAFMPVFGLSTAASIVVGQQLGKRRPRLASRGTWTTFSIALGYMLFVSTLYVTLPDLFLFGFFPGDVADRNPAIRELAVILLRYVAAYNVFDACNLVFVSAIKGAGDTRFVFIVSLVMAVLLGVGTWVGLHWLGTGLRGCWTLVTAWISVLGLIYLARFLQGTWRTMRVIDPIPAIQAI